MTLTEAVEHVFCTMTRPGSPSNKAVEIVVQDHLNQLLGKEKYVIQALGMESAIKSIFSSQEDEDEKHFKFAVLVLGVLAGGVVAAEAVRVDKEATMLH